MTLCPVALAVGCKKCPAFSFCPLKTVIGDAPKSEPTVSLETETSGRKAAKSPGRRYR